MLLQDRVAQKFSIYEENFKITIHRITKTTAPEKLIGKEKNLKDNTTR